MRRIFRKEFRTTFSAFERVIIESFCGGGGSGGGCGDGDGGDLWLSVVSRSNEPALLTEMTEPFSEVTCLTATNEAFIRFSSFTPHAELPPNDRSSASSIASKQDSLQGKQGKQSKRTPMNVLVFSASTLTSANSLTKASSCGKLVAAPFTRALISRIASIIFPLKNYRIT